MQAAFYETPGSAEAVLRIGEVETPRAGPGEVRVRITVSGVNPVDGYQRAGLLGPLAFPRIIPGHDGAGTIDEVGDGVDRRRLGQRVWLYNAQWQRAAGTMAAWCTVPAEHAVALPERVDDALGAMLGTVARTAHAALTSAWPAGQRIVDGLMRGRHVLVQGGAGATALAAIQMARAAGATVIATVSDPAKADVASRAGAHHVLDYRSVDVADAVLEITQGRGVDQILEVNLAANAGLDGRLLAQDGWLVVYGSPGDFEPRVPLIPALFKQARIRLVGSFTLSPTANHAAIADIEALLRADMLTLPVAGRFPLQRAAEAHALQDSGRAIGKVLVDLTQA